MAYYTGSFSSRNDLYTTFTNLCVSNGWTLSSGQLSKSMRYGKTCHIDIDEYSTNYIRFTGNTALGDAAYGSVVIGGTFVNPNGFDQYSLTYPGTYHIHIFDYEVYLVINYNSLYWQWVGFGQSKFELPGDGTFLFASMAQYIENYDSPSTTALYPGSYINTISTGRFAYRPQNPFISVAQFPFALTGSTTIGQSWYVHSDIGGVGWYKKYTAAADGGLNTIRAPLDDLIPNTWNSEAVLLPMQAWFETSSSVYSMIVDLDHFKFTRNDYYDDGEVVSVGTNDWSIYPISKKDTTYRDGTTSVSYGPISGTLAFAIRHDEV